MKILTTKEREQLLSNHKKEKDGRIKDRIKVLIHYDEGESIEEIAKFLLLDPQTIIPHIKEYKEEKILKTSNGSSSSKLSKDQAKELSNHLENHTYTKVKEISDYILKTYGIKYSNSGLTNWLHENGFTYKKPVGLPSKINEKAQEDFIQKYREIEKKGKKSFQLVFNYTPFYAESGGQVHCEVPLA